MTGETLDYWACSVSSLLTKSEVPNLPECAENSLKINQSFHILMNIKKNSLHGKLSLPQPVILKEVQIAPLWRFQSSAVFSFPGLSTVLKN